MESINKYSKVVNLNGAEIPLDESAYIPNQPFDIRVYGKTELTAQYIECGGDSYQQGVPSAINYYLQAGNYKFTTPKGIYEVTIPHDMHGMTDNVKDLIIFDVATEKGWMKKTYSGAIFDGSADENWRTLSLDTNAPSANKRYVINLPDALGVDNNLKAVALCNRLTVNTATNGYVGLTVNAFAIQPSKDLNVYVTDVDLPSFKQSLTANPLVIMYKKEFAVKIPLTFTKVASSVLPNLPIKPQGNNLAYPNAVTSGSGTWVSAISNIIPVASSTVYLSFKSNDNLRPALKCYDANKNLLLSTTVLSAPYTILRGDIGGGYPIKTESKGVLTSGANRVSGDTLIKYDLLDNVKYIAGGIYTGSLTTPVSCTDLMVSFSQLPYEPFVSNKPLTEPSDDYPFNVITANNFNVTCENADKSITANITIPINGFENSGDYIEKTGNQIWHNKIIDDTKIDNTKPLNQQQQAVLPTPIRTDITATPQGQELLKLMLAEGTKRIYTDSCLQPYLSADIIFKSNPKNIMEHLPPYWHENKQFKTLCKINNAVLDDAYIEFCKVLDNTLVDTMDEQSVLLLENWLGIKGEGTLEQRKRMLKVSKQYPEKINTKYIRTVVGTLTGGGGCKVEFYKKGEAGNNALIRLLVVPNKSQTDYKFDDISRALINKIPAHISLKVDKYVTSWGEIKNRVATWNDLGQNSNWQSVLDLILIENIS